MKVPVDVFAKPISDAARIVRRQLPASNSLELADLVQIGWERVARYLGDAPVSTVLVFVCAKQGMLEEARHWAGCQHAKDGHGHPRRIGAAPRLEGYQEWFSFTPAPPIELLIDVYRTLLAMPLRESASWYSRHVLDEPVGTLAPEFGVSRGRICQYEMAARDKLREVVLSGEERRESQTRILGTAKLQREQVERQRYRELRDMGATRRQAMRGCKSPNCFASMAKQLTPEAAE